MKIRKLNESVNTANDLLSKIYDSIDTSDEKVKSSLDVIQGELEVFCDYIARTPVREKCKWVRTTFNQISIASHPDEPNHVEPRTVMHFIAKNGKPAFDIVLNFRMNKGDTRNNYYSKNIMLGLPVEGMITDNTNGNEIFSIDVESENYHMTCQKVADRGSAIEFGKAFFGDGKSNGLYEDIVVPFLQANGLWFETKDDLINKYKNEINNEIREFAEEVMEDPHYKISGKDILKIWLGVLPLIKKAQKDNITIFNREYIKTVFESECEKAYKYNKEMGIYDSDSDEDDYSDSSNGDSRYSDYQQFKQKLNNQDNYSIGTGFVDYDDDGLYNIVKNTPSKTTTVSEAFINREQTYAFAQKLIHIFIDAGWDEIKLNISKDNDDVITITPKFKDTEKSEETVNNYIVKLNGKVIKELCAQTITRLARQLLYLRERVDQPINVSVSLNNTLYDNIRDAEEISNNIESCQVGDEVKLSRIANSIRNKGLTDDETAIEVRTMDNKPLGFLPWDLSEKDIIARRIMRHTPYTAKIISKFNHGKNINIVIQVKI